MHLQKNIRIQGIIFFTFQRDAQIGPTRGLFEDGNGGDRALMVVLYREHPSWEGDQFHLCLCFRHQWSSNREDGSRYVPIK